MKWFLICLIFYLAAAGLSRYWSKESALSQAIAQQRGSGVNFAGSMLYENTKVKKCSEMRADAMPDRCRTSRRRW
jgi:hypothetical protein